MTPDFFWALLQRAEPAMRPMDRDTWSAALSSAAAHAKITTPRQACHWLAQLTHESAGFQKLTENLNYSASGLRKTWPKRFQTEAIAMRYARRPQDIANRVYNGRMGNRSIGNDGWHFRGRGPIQLTGRANYTAFEVWCKSIGRPATIRTDPDLLCAPEYGALAAAWFWGTNGLSALVDAHPDEADACEAVTRRINGGTHGLADRYARLQTLLRGIR